VFNASFNNDSVILWLSDLLADETGVSGVIHRFVSGEETGVSGVIHRLVSGEETGVSGVIHRLVSGH
jgi:methyl coenzyme M reductase beta subunit